jgi:hypothetical protein
MKSINKIYFFLYLSLLFVNKISSLSLRNTKSNAQDDEKPIVGISLAKMSKCNEENKTKCENSCLYPKERDMCFCFQFEGKTNLRCECTNKDGSCPRF